MANPQQPIACGACAWSRFAHWGLSRNGNCSTGMYDFACEHCSGTVRERRIDREALRHKRSLVILQDVPIGVCDRCGARYFDASVLRRVAEIGRGTVPTQQTLAVPIAPYSPV